MTASLANQTAPQTDREQIKRLWRDYIWPQKKRLLAAFFFMTLLALATASYTLVVNYIIEQAQSIDTQSGANALETPANMQD